MPTRPAPYLAVALLTLALAACDDAHEEEAGNLVIGAAGECLHAPEGGAVADEAGGNVQQAPPDVQVAVEGLPIPPPARLPCPNVYGTQEDDPGLLKRAGRAIGRAWRAVGRFLF